MRKIARLNSRVGRDAGLKFDPRMKNSGARNQFGRGQILFVNSRDFSGEYAGTSYSLVVHRFPGREAMQQCYWYSRIGALGNSKMRSRSESRGEADAPAPGARKDQDDSRADSFRSGYGASLIRNRSSAGLGAVRL